MEYSDYPKVAARIISKDPGNWYDTFMINKGSKDGIRVDNNVIAGKGLVGIVTEEMCIRDRVSAGWRITEESWWSERTKRWFSNLKLKASYGVVGDESTSGYSAFDYLEGYNYNSGGAVLDGEWILGSQYRGLPVTDLSWQKVE